MLWFPDVLSGFAMFVAVLLGGTSSERPVSLRSGGAVASALETLGHEVVRVDVTSESVDALLRPGVEVYFIALHGRFGEDGTLQRLLEERNIRFTGSGSVASATAMDKVSSKEVFLRAGITTPCHVVIATGEDPAAVDDKLRSIGYPLVLKPRAEGSSVGVSIHQNEGTVREGLATALKYGMDILVEQFIAGRELTVSVLEDRPLPIIEMIPRRQFFDYEAKYEDQETKYIVKPTLTKENEEKVQAVALAAHKALGCRCFSRVDVMLTARGEAHVLEVNTIPGLTERSLLPKAARAAGIDFPALCMKIVADAMNR